MRLPRPAGSAGFAFMTLLAFGAAPAAAFAQSGPFTASVVDPEAKLRAGPSDQFPETGTLRKGTFILVDHEESNGWLAVQDVPGQLTSVSWVQTQFIDFDKNKPIPQLVPVDEGGVTLRAGQIGLAQPLHIQKVKVPGGTILTVIGQGVSFEGKTWYPVAPPVGDFRYLPKQAVKFEKAANPAFVVRDMRDSAPPLPALSTNTLTSPVAPASGVSSLPGVGTPATGTGAGVVVGPPGALPAGPATTAGKPAVQHPLWAQAEAAERDGRFDDAEKVFFQLARVMNEPGGDHDVANLCYTRIHTLREKKRGVSPVTPTASTPPANARTSTNTAPKGVSGGPPTAIGDAQPQSDAKDERPRWSGPGKLVRSALALDGRKTYALESNPGAPVMYVIAGQGVDLEKYVNKRVDVYGAITTRQNPSKPVMVATEVNPGQ